MLGTPLICEPVNIILFAPHHSLGGRSHCYYHVTLEDIGIHRWTQVLSGEVRRMNLSCQAPQPKHQVGGLDGWGMIILERLLILPWFLGTGMIDVM